MSNDVSIYGNYDANEDFKDMRQSDKILPRLRLMNFSSPLVKDRKAEAGCWIDSATEATVIQSGQTGPIIPIMYFLEWIEWNPDKGAPKEKRIIARSADPLSDIAKAAERREQVQTAKGMKPRVTEYYSFLVLAPGYFGNYNDMMMLNFSRSGHRVGKTWLNRMRGFKVKDGESIVQAPMWAVAWDLGSASAVKDGDQYYVPSIGNGTAISADVVPMVRQVAIDCKAQRDALMNKNSNAKDDEVAAEVAGTADSDL